MSPAGTMARVYEALKTRVMEGAFAPGERIDPARLSAELHASATPIRDALWRLAGERLVESWTQEGFRQPFLTEARLLDLYGWNEEVLRLILRALERSAPPVEDESEPVADAGSTFAWLARRSSNLEHGMAILSLNERLYAVRRIEGRVLADAALETVDLVDAVRGQRWAAARQWISRYHAVRLRRVREIAAQLQRPSG